MILKPAKDRLRFYVACTRCQKSAEFSMRPLLRLTKYRFDTYRWKPLLHTLQYVDRNAKRRVRVILIPRSPRTRKPINVRERSLAVPLRLQRLKAQWLQILFEKMVFDGGVFAPSHIILALPSA
jgi:hypothetical protein